MEPQSPTKAELRPLISLASLAKLTRVQRPVVSMWRSRHAHTEYPFPHPVLVQKGQPFFDCEGISNWLVQTGLGNNPTASEDILSFAQSVGVDGPPSNEALDLTALIALKELTGAQLASFALDELLDAADEADPDDLFLFSEVLNIGELAVSMAKMADRFVDAAFSTTAAFERLLEERGEELASNFARTDLSPQALKLVAGLALELGLRNRSSMLNFVDLMPQSSDLLLAVKETLPESLDATFTVGQPSAPAAADTGSTRTARRRLAVHGILPRELPIEEIGQFSAAAGSVHCVQLPPPGNSSMSASQMLNFLENVVLQMDDTQSGVVIAPAGVLADPLSQRELKAVRSDILRLGRLRAIVRLPQGLSLSKSRTSLALWVLGPAHASVPIADRWTMVADLSSSTLTKSVIQDLLGDLALSLADEATIRAHSLRFAKLVKTSWLLASGGEMTRNQTPSQLTASGAEYAVEIEKLVTELNTSTTDQLSLVARPLRRPAGQTSIGVMSTSGHVSVHKGLRLDPALVTKSDAGARVIGAAEIRAELGRASLPRRSIDRLVLASSYPKARFTEPGDIVFLTTPRALAIVDDRGGSVVEFPARTMRISGTDPGGLTAPLLAADVNVSAGKDWRHWKVRTISESSASELLAALARIEIEREAAAARNSQLTQLTELICNGIGNGNTKVELTTDSQGKGHTSAPQENN